jgi:hypothetical protein
LLKFQPRAKPKHDGLKVCLGTPESQGTLEQGAAAISSETFQLAVVFTSRVIHPSRPAVRWTH